MNKIAFAKGIIQKKALSLLEKKYGVNINQKKLCVNLENNIFYFLKHRDIPELVEKGIIDIGITSFEWIKEKKVNLCVLKKLDWCNTRICYISEEGFLGKDNNLICITEFPNIAQDYFEKENMNVDIRKVSGSSEAYVPGLADICVDCVETGTTLAENGLRIYDVILESTVVVCTKKENRYIYEPLIKELFNNE